MSTSGLPTPKKVVVNGETLFVSMFSTDILLNVGTRTIKNGQMSLPVSFQANCRKLIQTKIGEIAKWFNPVPTKEKLERVITTLPTIECSTDNLREIQTKNVSNIVVRMDGIIVEDNRILPYLTVVIPRIPQYVDRRMDAPKSQDSMVEVVDLELDLEPPIEIHDNENKVINRDFDMEGGPDDDEDDDDDDDDDDDEDEESDDDDDEDTDDDFDRNFEKVQRTLDSAREELEALRRRHLAKKSLNR